MGSLKEILNQLAALDADDESLDPAVVVGELNGKVDGIKAKIDEWEAEIERLEKWEHDIALRISTYQNAIKRLTKYVEYEMTRHKYEKLPGEIWEMKWKKNPPKVDIDIPADAKTYLSYREFMGQKTSYNWDKVKLKEAIKAGQKFDFARLVQDQKIVFGVKKK